MNARQLNIAPPPVSINEITKYIYLSPNCSPLDFVGLWFGFFWFSLTKSKGGDLKIL